MQISLRETKAESFKFKQVQNHPSEDTFKLSFYNDYDKTNELYFLVKFDISLKSKEGFTLSLSYVAYFETDDAINDDFKTSHFVKVNAPAIAYPFLRSFIATLVVNSGHEAVILPTINFQALSEAEDE